MISIEKEKTTSSTDKPILSSEKFSEFYFWSIKHYPKPVSISGFDPLGKLCYDSGIKCSLFPKYNTILVESIVWLFISIKTKTKKKITIRESFLKWRA